MYIKYATQQNSAKMSFKCHTFFNEIMRKRPKRESKELLEKSKCDYQIYISIKVNIHRTVMKI